MSFKPFDFDLKNLPYHRNVDLGFQTPPVKSLITTPFLAILRFVSSATSSSPRVRSANSSFLESVKGPEVLDAPKVVKVELLGVGSPDLGSAGSQS